MTKYKEGDLMTPIDQLRRMATKDENGLLPCPCCGSKAHDFYTQKWVEELQIEGKSQDYYCATQYYPFNSQLSAQQWNTRAIDAPALLAEIEKMQTEADAAKNSLKIWQDIVFDLTQENKKMQECLEWYADEKKHEPVLLQHDSWGRLGKNSEIRDDKGQRARDCLNGLTKEKKDD